MVNIAWLFGWVIKVSVSPSLEIFLTDFFLCACKESGCTSTLNIYIDSKVVFIFTCEKYILVSITGMFCDQRGNSVYLFLNCKIWHFCLFCALIVTMPIEKHAISLTVIQLFFRK